MILILGFIIWFIVFWIALCVDRHFANKPAPAKVCDSYGTELPTIARFCRRCGIPTGQKLDRPLYWNGLNIHQQAAVDRLKLSGAPKVEYEIDFVNSAQALQLIRRKLMIDGMKLTPRAVQSIESRLV